MSIARWGLASLLAMCSLVAIVANGETVVRGFVLKERTPSFVPLIGGLAGVLSIMICPARAVHSWWWLPLLLDWGSVPGIAHALWWHTRR